MAKFCGNCGYQSDDTAVVCGNCGAPLGGEVAAPAQASKGKMIKLGAIVAAVAVVAIVLVLLLSGGGYKSVVDDVFTAFIENEPSILVDLTPDYVFEFGSKAADLKDQYKNEIESAQERWEDKTDKDYSVSYTITDTDEYSEEEFEDFVDDIKEYIKSKDDADFDVDLIEEIMEVELDVVIEEGDECYEYDAEITLIKIDGDWKVLGYDLW